MRDESLVVVEVVLIEQYDVCLLGAEPVVF